MYMSRIHPSDQNKYDHAESVPADALPSVAVLTVWKRSSMAFHGTDGFTVFNGEGRLAFRVDNYSRMNPCFRGGGLVLMDGAGKPLLTLKPLILSMQYQWNGYKGDGGSSSNPILFSMRRPSMLVGSNNDEAEVFMGGRTRPTPDFRIEGSFRKRNCKIRGPTGRVVAEISRKKVVNTTVLLSDDVFNLVVQPDFDCELIMAFVVIMDRICRKPFAPLLLCS